MLCCVLLRLLRPNVARGRVSQWSRGGSTAAQPCGRPRVVAAVIGESIISLLLTSPKGTEAGGTSPALPPAPFLQELW